MIGGEGVGRTGACGGECGCAGFGALGNGAAAGRGKDACLMKDTRDKKTLQLNAGGSLCIQRF